MNTSVYYHKQALSRAALNFESSLWMLSIRVKAIEQYFPEVLFIMMYTEALSFDPVDEILRWGHSDER